MVAIADSTNPSYWRIESTRLTGEQNFDVNSVVTQKQKFKDKG